MGKTVQRCFWEDGQLVIVTSRGEYRLSSSDGIRALKTNTWALPDGRNDKTEDSPTIQSFPLFDPDEPRRMALIQERLSGLGDRNF